MSVELREPLKLFAQVQEIELRQNDYKGGWENCPLEYLESRLLDELAEYYQAKLRGDNNTQANEAIDIANFCMMIWDNLTSKE